MLMEPLVSPWFWDGFDTDVLRVKARAMRDRADDVGIGTAAREAARQLADDMTAELARRAMKEKAA
jgi:hypothetical protein